MAKYPTNTSAPMKNPIRMGFRFKTLISEFEDLGEEKRRQKKIFPTRDLNIAYEWITVAEARIIWQFYQARAGAKGGRRIPFSQTIAAIRSARVWLAALP